MERALEYIEGILNGYKTKLNNIKSTLNEDYGILNFMERNAHDAVVCEFILMELNLIKGILLENADKEEKVVSIQKRQKYFENILLEGKAYRYTNSPSFNLAHLWIYETYPRIISIIIATLIHLK